jgi:endo-beta-N-acetylglucosaminidase D
MTTGQPVYLSPNTPELAGVRHQWLNGMMVQNQSGNYPLRWDKMGTVMKCEGFDQFQVMIDGSRRLTDQR